MDWSRQCNWRRFRESAVVRLISGWCFGARRFGAHHTLAEKMGRRPDYLGYCLDCRWSFFWLQPNQDVQFYLELRSYPAHHRLYSGRSSDTQARIQPVTRLTNLKGGAL